MNKTEEKKEKTILEKHSSTYTCAKAIINEMLYYAFENDDLKKLSESDCAAVEVEIHKFIHDIRVHCMMYKDSFDAKS